MMFFGLGVASVEFVPLVATQESASQKVVRAENDENTPTRGTLEPSEMKKEI